MVDGPLHAAGRRARCPRSSRSIPASSELLRQTGQVLFQRLTQDLKSNVHQLDVFASTDEAHMTILKKQNALAQFVPADIDKIP